ncbi:MAG: hypothetical protein R3C49_01675 [Planctomycetaceae bacterium]
MLLNAAGGHPDVPERAVIRRWVAPASGTLTIAGSLQHGSPNGDGVRGTSGRQPSGCVETGNGSLADWTCFNGKVDTPVSATTVEAGDTIDSSSTASPTRHRILSSGP